MNMTRTRRLTARFRVVADDGTEFAIEEFTEFLTVGPLSGPSETMAGGLEYRSGRRAVNLNDDGTFDVFVTSGPPPVRSRRA